MANREELALIRGARGGQRDAQLALGRLYLYGSAGLPKSLPTALHWLDRAAEQGSLQACELIGAHIPLELALQSARPVRQWYDKAYEGGNVRAGLVLAQLVLEHHGAQTPDAALRARALRALEQAARAGVPEASWLFARHQQLQAAVRPAGAPVRPPPAPVAAPALSVSERWRGAPDGGASPFELLWQSGERQAFLALALPKARAVAGSSASLPLGTFHVGREQATLLSRCARTLSEGPDSLRAQFGVDDDELHRFWDLAAGEHDPHAQLAMGLWQARMQVDGQRILAGAGSANFKKAIRWLALAGEQGLPQAWFALSRIYIKPEFSQRNVADAQTYLERAASMGYREAQLECGNNAWRARREHEGNDIKAVYWLQKAAGQGCAQAAAALLKIAPRDGHGIFAELAARAPANLSASHPLLAARLRLAALFKLNRAEALLLDIKAADHGHCLVVDIRASYGRCKRRLIAIGTVQERRALDDIVEQFRDTDPGPGGPEGNYRQRLYRLKTVLPEAHQCEEDAFEMAA